MLDSQSQLTSERRFFNGGITSGNAILPKNRRFRPDGGKTAGSSLMDFDGAVKPPFSNSG